MINKQVEKKLKAIKRKVRARAKFSGTAKVPRLSVFRSAKHLYLQLIDDQKRETLVAAKDTEVKNAAKLKPTQVAMETGAVLAKKALAKNIDQAVFDRGAYKYHGRVKAVAKGARQAGLKF